LQTFMKCHDDKYFLQVGPQVNMKVTFIL
jgi:hypothetical protein